MNCQSIGKSLLSVLKCALVAAWLALCFVGSVVKALFEIAGEYGVFVAMLIIGCLVVKFSSCTSETKQISRVGGHALKTS